jgi:hypothetical protein
MDAQEFGYFLLSVSFKLINNLISQSWRFNLTRLDTFKNDNLENKNNYFYKFYYVNLIIFYET